jgi:hypothetical protein
MTHASISENTEMFWTHPFFMTGMYVDITQLLYRLPAITADVAAQRRTSKTFSVVTHILCCAFSPVPV